MTADYAILLISKRLAAESHNSVGEKRRLPPKPSRDITSVCQANDAIRLFFKLVAISPQPLLGVLAQMEEYSVALYVFDEMLHSGFPVNETNIVICCCKHLNRVDYNPNLGTLLQWLFWIDKVSEAELFGFETMRV